MMIKRERRGIPPLAFHPPVDLPSSKHEPHSPHSAHCAFRASTDVRRVTTKNALARPQLAAFHVNQPIRQKPKK